MSSQSLPSIRQPALAHLRMRGISNRTVAETGGWHESWVSHVLQGRSKPTPAFRRVVAGLLQLPEEMLFRVEVEQ